MTPPALNASLKAALALWRAGQLHDAYVTVATARDRLQEMLVVQPAVDPAVRRIVKLLELMRYSIGAGGWLHISVAESSLGSLVRLAPDCWPTAAEWPTEDTPG